MAYSQIQSLQVYMLIEQDFVEVEVMRKTKGWLSERYYLGDVISFESIGLTLSVEDIYDRVQNTDVIEWLQQKQV